MERQQTRTEGGRGGPVGMGLRFGGPSAPGKGKGGPFGQEYWYCKVLNKGYISHLAWLGGGAYSTW